MTTTPPLDWIKEVDEALIHLDEKPQFGHAPPLDWHHLEENLRRLFNKPNLKLTHHAKGWMAPHQIVEGMGKDIMPLSVTWSEMATPIYFVTYRDQLRGWIVELFETEEGGQYFYDQPLIEGFYHYFAAEMLRQLDKLHFAAPLNAHLGPPVENLKGAIGEESCFVIDLALSNNERHFSSRLLLPATFRTEWKKYFAHLPPPPLSEAMKEKLNLEVSLEVAQSRLSLEDWGHVRVGDLVVLDHCSYNPIEHKGGVLLSLNQKPIFRGRIKDGNIKITNYPFYEQVSDDMEEKPFGRGIEDEHDNLYGDLDDEDEISEFEDEEEDEDEEDLFAGLEEPEREAKAKEPPPDAGAPPSLVAEELPVQLTIEVGRVKMTAAELMKLAPGNLIDLHVSPERGVDLVVNGKKMGRGELVRMGDVLGVRILSL